MKKAAVLILCVVLVCCVLVGCGNLPEEIYGSESNNEEFAPGQFYFTIENEQGDHESHQFVLRELVSGYDKDNTKLEIVYNPAYDDISREFHVADVKLYKQESGFEEPQELEIEEISNIGNGEITYMYNNGGTIRCDFIVVLDTDAERQYRICKRQVAQSDPLFEYTAPLTVWS